MNELANLRTLLESGPEDPKEHVFKMTDFTKLKEKREHWFSLPFYAFPGGYKMCLNVDTGGYADGKGTHISAFLLLMKGENDENLEWPMRGTFFIEVMNQTEDQYYEQRSLYFDETKANNYNSKVSNGCAI